MNGNEEVSILPNITINPTLELNITNNSNEVAL